MIFLALVFPFLLLFIMKCMLKIPGSCLVIPDSVNGWFSFYGSYAGVIVTIVLGLITLRLTLTLERIHRKETELQQQLSIAMNMPNMHSESISLSSLDKGDLPYDSIRLFENQKGHLLSLVMNPAFPPYFDIKINKMELRLKNPKEGTVIQESENLSPEDYFFTNNEVFTLVINIPRKMYDIFEQFYVVNIVTTESTNYQLLISDMWLDFICQNVFLEGMEAVSFRMHLEIMCEGKQQNGDGIAIKLISREFERMNCEVG